MWLLGVERDSSGDRPGDEGGAAGVGPETMNLRRYRAYGRFYERYWAKLFAVTQADMARFAHQIQSADNLPARVREAFRLAEEEKPGAVHLELPEDIAAEETAGRPIAPSFARRPVPETKAVRAAACVFSTAKRDARLRGSSSLRGVSSRSTGRSASGSMPICCRSSSRLGDADAKMRRGRQTLSSRVMAAIHRQSLCHLNR